MMSEVEERPRLVTGGYGWHRSQSVKPVRIRKDLVVNYTIVQLLIESSAL